MMDKKTLQDTAKKHVPAQHKGRNALIAFISGGALAVVAQLFMMLCMDMFDYDKAAQKCGAGLFIPISGFANCLTSCAIEGRTEGPIFGIGSNMFKLAGSVLTYGIAAAFVFGTIRYLLFGA